jgi:hypothetical protein
VKYILYAFLIYIAYQFIFKLVIPVYKTSQKIKKGFREMQSRMEQTAEQQQEHQQHPNSTQPDKKHKMGEYIDFEETK